MKILVAEDDAVSRKITQTLLYHWGYEVVVARDGVEAWDILSSKHAPPLCLLDRIMPGVDGLEVCRRLRALDAARYVYVILLTCRSAACDVVAGLDAGADDYVTKPFEPPELQSRLRAGERIVALEHRLRRRIEEYETVIRRHALLGLLCRLHGEATPVAPGETDVRPPPRMGDARAATEFPYIAAATLGRMGVGGIQVDFPGGRQTGCAGPGYLAWSPLLVPSTETWIDVTMAASRRSAETAYAAMLGRPASSHREIMDALAEILHITLGGWQRAFEADGLASMTPVIPRVVRPRAEEPWQASCGSSGQFFTLTFEGAALEFSLDFLHKPIRRKEARRLDYLDVVVEPIRASNTGGLDVLKGGTALDHHYLAKVKALFRDRPAAETISIMPPSERGLEFFRRFDEWV